MKKLFIFLLFFCGCAALVSAQNANLPNKLNTAVKKKLAVSSSANAHEDGVIMIKLMVGADFLDIDHNNEPRAKKCPAVRIAPNTLLASRACIDLSGKGKYYQYKGGGGEYDVSTHPVKRWIDRIIINGVTIGPRDFRENGLLLLIAIDGTNKKLKEAIEKLPISNLFVAKNAKKLQDTFPEITLNRDDMIFSDRECANVDIATVCMSTQCFQICWKTIDGDTGDPVFGRNPDKNKLEYLLGFNATNADLDGRHSGPWYHFLSQSSLNFMRKNLPAAEWNYINSHRRNENLYK